MKKKSILIIVLSILLAVTNIAWALHYLQSGRLTKSWVLARTWGTYDTPPFNRTTDTFKVEAEEWKVSFGYSEAAGSELCIVVVFDEYTHAQLTTLRFNSSTHERYQNLVGRFYLKIFLYGSFTQWYVQIHEYK